MKQMLIKTISLWFPMAATTTLLCGIIYIAVQQTLRRGADNVPVQNLWNAKQDLQNGISPEQITAQYRKIDMQHSLEPFVTIYDANGKAVASSATINNVIPGIPNGVLTTAEQKKENRLTWQLAPGIRNAITVIPFMTASGILYIVSGRSLYEVEKQEQMVLQLCLSGLTAILLINFVLILLIQYLKLKKVK